MRLTDSAKDLAGDLTEALDRMNHAVSRFKATGLTGTLRISVVPWHGYRYLAPNVSKLQAAHPTLDINFHFSYEVVDFQKDDFNAAMRHGLGGWENLIAYRLNHDQVSPVCTPSLVTDLNPPLSPKQIATMNLATTQQGETNWHDWFSLVGITKTDNLSFKYFENRPLATEFAVAGHGVSLSDLSAIDSELRSEQLVRLHRQILRIETGLHLVFPETPYPDPRLRIVADWMIDVLPSIETENSKHLIRELSRKHPH